MLRKVTYVAPEPKLETQEDSTILGSLKQWYDKAMAPDPAERISITQQGVDFEIEDLDDGIHLLKVSDDRLFIVVKDENPGVYVGFGYFGIQEVSKDYLPKERGPDEESSEFSRWTIVEGDFIEDLADGMHGLTIPGDMLNGKDLELSLIKDENPGVYVGYGYLGISGPPIK